MRLLIANRGDVAVRVGRSAAALGASAVSVYVPEDSGSLHVLLAQEARVLPGEGAAGYLDIEALVAAATSSGCTHVHPGWGFLSEDPDFARACARAGLVFVGPAPECLALFGDKAHARAHALATGVPVLDATDAGVTVDQARSFMRRYPGGVMVKAAVGGGGRGMRAVTEPAQLAEAFERCRSEALKAFGHGELYVERLVTAAKHVEVQVLGDGSGSVVSLGERECSVQRRHQKLLEVAPSPSLDDRQRGALARHAVRLTEAVAYSGLGTVEFLVDADALDRGELDVAFIEVNPRLQVEHTVTEEVTGLDLVQAQLRVADGATLAELGLTQELVPAPVGFAVQARINAEGSTDTGDTFPSTGTLTTFRTPGGPGVRVDTHAQVGLQVTGSFDSLLAKVVVHVRSGGFAAAAALARRALDELEIDGVDTNAAVLKAVLAHPVFLAGHATTDFMARYAAEWPTQQSAQDTPGEPGMVIAAFPGTVVAVDVSPGDVVSATTRLVVVEAMKMENVLTSGRPGVVRAVEVQVGDQLVQGQVVVRLYLHEGAGTEQVEQVEQVDLALVRPDLQEVHDRHARGLDAARSDAVGRRHRRGHRTIRENLDDLVDAGTFSEYGPLAIAAQRRRRPVEELMDATPADGIVLGVASVNGDVAPEAAPCVVIGYDQTVLAGTQGYFGHKKTDRLIEIAERRNLPVVLFAEGGGGRPGEIDAADIASSYLDTRTFALLARLSGQVPLVGVLTGHCYAGNAGLLGVCDVIIATKDSTLGMAGPAMIQSAGLGTFTPEQVGPMTVHGRNGVVDVLVDDDAAAVAVAKRYLSYFQGRRQQWTCQDQRALRQTVPDNRRRVYDIRRVIEVLADTDSVLELRAGFGAGAITALARIDGRPVGLMANNPAHLGGAIDTAAADKLARFLQLCDGHGLPVVSLCDTPGFMVGPESEKTATVRHVSRLFVIGANLRVPLVTVVLRKGYGLGGQAMAGGGFRETLATLAWPTGEVGPMGLEGAVQLGYSRELEAIADEGARDQRYQDLVAQHYESGKAVNAAMVVELDDVIDPADTRRWVSSAFAGWSPPAEPHRSYIDTW